MKFRKAVDFIPVGDLPKVEEADRKKLAKEFFENPLIPWWTKVVAIVWPTARKPDRTATWCKRCGRKHSKQAECSALELVEDLTAPPTKTDEEGNPVPNRRVGHYRARTET
jgi:hypothetical protein